jgi:hypothetical protein
VSSPSALSDFVFPVECLQNPVLCATRSILAPTNVQVHNYNKFILNLLHFSS